MPKVTVIVPVFNAGEYLAPCLDGVLGQTLSDIEVLCVDDGSTDDSVRVLEEYASRDPRVKVMSQANRGAGAARNHALDAATGQYLCFLDADDLFEPDMLELAAATCDADDADVCVFGAGHYDTRTRRRRPAGWLLRRGRLPKTIPFSSHDAPDDVMVFTVPAPWNKLFRREFVEEQGLRFQEIKRTNDLLFTRLALVKARRITVVDKVLVYYRVGHETNLQATNDETPLEFVEALVALREELERSGHFAMVERGYVNDALSICLHNLNSIRRPAVYVDLYRRLRDELLAELGIAGRPEEYFFSAEQYQQSVMILKLTPGEYLVEQVEDLQRQAVAAAARVGKAKASLASTQAKIKRIKSSRSYRIGRRLGSIARTLAPGRHTAARGE